MEVYRVPLLLVIEFDFLQGRSAAARRPLLVRREGKMRFLGAIFDLDGTLVDSNPVWQKVDEDFLKMQGIVPPPEDYHKAIEIMPVHQAACYTIERFGLTQSPDEITNMWRQMAVEAYEKSVPEKPGALMYLKKLKEMGIKLAVATASERALYEPCLKRLGMWELFDGVFDVYQAGHGKDRPDIYLMAARAMGLEIKDVLVFEDALSAIQTARKAGFRAICVEDGYTQKSRPAMQAASDGYITHFSQAPLPGERDQGASSEKSRAVSGVGPMTKSK